MSKPYIEFITCESGDWKVLRINYREDFKAEGHSLSDLAWIRLIRELGFEIKCKTISDEDMENENY